MSTYGELGPIAGKLATFAFKVKRQRIIKVNMPNMASPGQHINIEIPHDSRDHAIVPVIVKIMFYFNIKSIDEARRVVNNVGRALVKKKVLMLGSKEIETTNNSDIYDTYKDLYLNKIEGEEKLLQGIQSANPLKTRVGGKKAGGTALIVTTQENAIKRTFDKRFAVPLDFDFFKHPVYLYGLREDLTAMLELNSSENNINYRR